MFYRWAKRLESMQLPPTAFPAAGGDPVVATDDSVELDSALVAASMAGLWLVLRFFHASRFDTADWAVITYAPIFLVAVMAALLVRRAASPEVIGAHVAVYAVISAFMGFAWVALGHSGGANPAFDAIWWGAFFAMLGLVTAVLCIVVWAVTLRQLSTPGTTLYNNAGGFRLLCVALILFAALIGIYKAINAPLA